jgi:hypothetical protein
MFGYWLFDVMLRGVYGLVKQASVFTGRCSFAGASRADTYFVAKKKIVLQRVVGREYL